MNFRVFQSLWAMERLPYRGVREWTLEEKFAKIIDAGFDGIAFDWSANDPDGPESIERAQAAGIQWAPVCFPKSVEDFKPIVDRFAGTGVHHINIQPNFRPLTIQEGVPYVLGMLELAEEAGVSTYIETHRARLTTSLRDTIQLIDAIPHMRLVADLSHFVVGEEFSMPLSDFDDALIHRVLERSYGFHGRVASREQVQIPLEFPHHRQWIDLFAGWWEEGFRLWRQKAQPEDELVFVTELGPGMWYAITGADGEELSDRWEEALVLQRLAREIWGRLEAKTEAPPNR